MTGVEEPDWIAALRVACAGSSQNRVARRLGYSAPVISTVLKGRYKGNLGNVEEVVRARLMDARVDCPALNRIELAACLQHKKNAESWAGTNPLSAKMYRACRACPRFTKED